MRKLGFYPKLAVSNLLRNRATYSPYLLACVVCVVTFYTMLSINNNAGVQMLRGGYIIAGYSAMGTVLLAIFCSILLFYTNSFLIKRRKKELGLYSILGMEKANIGIVMLFETAFMAMVSLLLGLVSGALLSRLLYIILQRLLKYPVLIDLPFSWSAMGISAVFFGAIFLLTLLSNLRQVHTVNPVELMAGAKQGEKEPRASWILTLIGLATLIAGYVMAIRVENPMDAVGIFLVAALLVIVGTFCLFTSGSVALLKALRHNKQYYYHPRRFISTSGMIYRMKQNAAGLSAICILSCMVLVTVSATVALYLGADEALERRFPRDFTMSLNDSTDAEQLMNGMAPLLAQNGMEITYLHDITYASYFTKRSGDAFSSTTDYGTGAEMASFQLIPLDVYNRAEQKNETLAPGEALLFCTGTVYEGDTLTLDGIPYRVRPLDTYYGTAYGDDGVGASYLLILPDIAAIEAAMAVRDPAVLEREVGKPPYKRQIDFDTTGSAEAKLAFSQDVTDYAGTISTSATFSFSCREDERDEWYATYGGILFLGIYFGILFLLATALIIYYKQISEGSDDAGRYEILQKVGMSGSEVKRSINSQILSVFFLPLGAALIHMLFAYNPINRAMMIFGIYSKHLLLLATLGTVIVYALIYALVYKGTARAYYNLVRMDA